MDSEPFALIDLELRALYPDLFAKVDAIKAQPGWEEFATDCGDGQSRASFDRFSWIRCGVCDEHFVSEGGARFCSTACRARNRARQRRSASRVT